MRFPTIISYIFNPLFMPLYGMILFLQLPPYNMLPILNAYKMLVLVGTLFFTLLLPLTAVLLMRRSGSISDIFISERSQRATPYLYTLMSYVFWIIFLQRIAQMPAIMVHLAVGATLSIALLLIINFKWKISAHLTGIGGLIGGFFGVGAYIGINLLWGQVALILLAGLVMYARLALNCHTPAQTVAGLFMGIGCTFVPCLF